MASESYGEGECDESIHEDPVPGCVLAKDVRSEGLKERSRPASGSWYSRAEGDPSKEKVVFKPDSSSCTSIFVGNIPPTMSHKKLKAWYSDFGPVVGVFIFPRRSKIDGSLFSFVRLRNLMDAHRACAKTDGSMIEGFLVVANLARFARSGSFSQSRGNAFLPGAVLRPSTSVSGNVSFLQALKSGVRDEGHSIKAAEEDCDVPGSFVEDASFVDAVFKLRCNCSTVNSSGIVDCISSVHQVGSSSGLWSVKECDYSYAGQLSEDELRGWGFLKSGCESSGVSYDEISSVGNRNVVTHGVTNNGFLDEVGSELIGIDANMGTAVGARDPIGKVSTDVVRLDGFVCNVKEGIPRSRGSLPDQFLAPKGYHIINKENFEAVTNGLIDGVSEAFELGESVGIDIPYEVKFLIIAIMEKRQVFLKMLFKNG